MLTSRREKRRRNDPTTPDKHANYSKRAWEGTMKVWRRKLHAWDPVELQEQYHQKMKCKQAPDNPLADLPTDEALTMERVEMHLKKRTNSNASLNPEAPEFTPVAVASVGGMVSPSAFI